MQITAGIIDDELNGRLAIANQIRKYCPQIEVIFQAEGVKEGIAYLQKKMPDVIFLDISMGDGSGFDLLNQIGAKLTSWVIFTTAYEEFAIKAFRYSAIDYLLKPIDPDLLTEAVNKISIYSHNQFLQQKLSILEENKADFSTIALQTHSGLQYVKILDILRCEADSNYTTVFFNRTEKIVVSKSLGDFEDLLENKGFARVHKSHIINLKKVKNTDFANNNLVMEDNSIIEIARRRKEYLIAALKK